MYASAQLATLGYRFVPGQSGLPSDWVLRQASDAQRGFEWKGQADYDELGDAVVTYAQAQLPTLCGLDVLPLPATGAAEAHSAVYASPELQSHRGPLLLLVCGSAPGGAAGIWGRSLCINASLHEGAMFDYILRAQQLGWSVLVANPNVNDVAGVPVGGSECPHLHLRTLWRAYVEPSAASCVLVVAHSYGAAALVHLLKVEASARERVHAVAFTDGGAFPPGTLLCEEVRGSAGATGSRGNAAAVRDPLQRFAELAPAAFRPPSGEVVERLARVGRNFVASQLPAGTPIAADQEGVPAVSAGHEKHPSTTHAATEVVFAFLQQGAEGLAATSNDDLRSRCPA